jgi:hypothetical protein
VKGSDDEMSEISTKGFTRRGNDPVLGSIWAPDDAGVTHAARADVTGEDDVAAVDLGPGAGVVAVAHTHVDLLII